MSCPKCQARGEQSSNFCSHCGPPVRSTVVRDQPSLWERLVAFQQGIRSDLWTFFTSITLGIVLLALILILSLIETLIPQAAWTREVDYIARYGVEGYGWIKRLGLDNIYGSWYFLLSIMLFFLNLSFNTYVRLQASIRWWRTDFAKTETAKLAALPLHRRLEFGPVSADPRRIKGQVRSALRRRFYRVKELPEGLFAQKWKFERFGIDVLHISLLAVIIGLALTYTLGFRTFQTAHKGEIFEAPQGGFSVKVEDFWSENYPDSERIMDWKSTLTILEGGQSVKTQTIEVNKPLIYKGIWFYQAAFGQDWQGAAQVTLRVERASEGKELGEFAAKVDDGFTIPDEGLFVAVKAFLPDFGLTENGIVYSRTQRLLNPAAYVEVYDAKGQMLMRTWTFSQTDMQELVGQLSRDLPYRIRLVGMKAPEFTGLQINADPGLPVAYGGFIMMFMGFLTHLFFKHKVIWVRLEEAPLPLHLTIGGMARNNPISFAQEFEQIVRALQVGLNARTSTETETETRALATISEGSP